MTTIAQKMRDPNFVRSNDMVQNVQAIILATQWDDVTIPHRFNEWLERFVAMMRNLNQLSATDQRKIDLYREALNTGSY
jgi:hypothetical protein